MKTPIIILALAATTFVACTNKQTENNTSDSLITTSTNNEASSAKIIPGYYRDLSTGEKVYVIVDPNMGYAIDSISRVPIEFYIDNSGDTLSKDGIVVNNALINTDGKWSVDETKIKVRDNGDIKIKNDDGKLKITDDKIKLKDNDGKIKIEDDTIKFKNK